MSCFAPSRASALLSLLALVSAASAAGTYSVKDLGTFSNRSNAHGVNASGQVVGDCANTFFTVQHGFLYSGGSMSDLGTLGGTSDATAINAAGQVVGFSDAGTGTSHAFLYSGGTMLDLGTLTANRHSYAYAINGSGLVVGSGYDASGQRAIVYSAGALRDLNSMLDASGAGWTLQAATGLNDSGQIVGYGYHDGQNRAFLLTPQAVPEPTTMAALGLGALGLLKRRKKA